ncbi:MAG: hypothetical protein ACI814_005052 [Mariniblastus sp.]|jgi:hypothetical protein
MNQTNSMIKSATRWNASPRLVCLCWLGACLLGGSTSRIGFASQVHDQTPIELSGFSISESYDVEDGAALDVNAPKVKQLLYRVMRTSPESRSLYSQYSSDIAWDDVVNQAADYRFWVFDKQAVLKSVRKTQLANLSPAEEIQHVFVCHCELADADSSIPFVVISRTLPKSLSKSGSYSTPVSMSGFFYANAVDSHSESPTSLPVFIVDQLGWYPTETSADVSPAHLRLAKHGMDVGLIDSIQSNNTKPLGSADAEAFFQLMGAIKSMDSVFDDSIGPKLGFTELMQKSESNFGEAVRIRGMVRSCSEITIPHPDIRKRLGVSKYYQLMIFPDLDGAKVVVRSKDGGTLDYRKFPVTICCTELPAGVGPRQIERTPVEVQGYFFRFWKYQSEKTQNVGVAGQISPLIVTKIPRILPQQSNRLTQIITVFVIAVIFGVAILLLYFRSAGQRRGSGRSSAGAQILDTLPEKIDLSGVED